MQLLPLLVDAAGLYVRRVWEAWDTTGTRTRRWFALVAVTATIRAGPLEDYEPYRRPRPMEKKQVHNGQGVYFVDFDPEDQPEGAAVPA